MHPSTFRYLRPTDPQFAAMEAMRQVGDAFAQALEVLVPDGPDKTYVMRKHREVCMWANVAITRLPDGTPRP